MEKICQCDFAEEMVKLLEKAKGEKADIAAAVYGLIQKTEAPLEAFRFFLENADDVDSLEEEEIESYFTASQLQKLEAGCGQMVEGIFDKLLSKNMDPEDFYSELWKKTIRDSYIFENDNEKIYALYRIWIDGRIPYFKIGSGLKMSDEKFSAIIKEKKNEIKKAIFILNSSFSQRTERCSLLVDILDACAEEEEKAVILAQMLSLTERKSMAKVLKDIKDSEF